VTTTGTTATGTGRHRKPPPPDERTVHRAEVLLRRAQLQPDPDVDTERMVAMLARVLARHDPFTSEHGRLVVAALRARSKRERRAGPRPAAEHAVRYLLGAGEAPWPKAVAGAVAQQRAHDRARSRRAVRLAPLAVRDGPEAARTVAGWWRDYNRPPTPNQLGKQLGWDAHTTWAVIHQLVDLGWLALHDRQLQPGPRARGQTPAAPVR
jgi:hypothetical protein